MDRFAIHNLFGIQGFDIAWYGIIIGTGMVLCCLLAGWRAKNAGYKTDLILDFVLWGIPIGVICARIYYVIFEWDYYRLDLMKIFAFREGGLAIYGGVIGGILTAVIFCKLKKFPFWRFMDLAIPSLILGQIIGRWGNFFNQEAFGNLIADPKLQFFPYGVFIEELGEWHQATFFYESFWNLIVLIIMLLVARKVKQAGWMPVIYFIGYGIGRYFIEGLRTDSLYLIPGLRVSQLVSVALIVLGIVMAWLIKSGRLKAGIYHGPYETGWQENAGKAPGSDV